MIALDQEPRVEVTISDAFRAILSAARDIPEPPQPVLSDDAGQASRSPDAWPWQPLALRRDGARPLRFSGMLVLLLECRTDTPQPSTRQKLAVFVAEDDRVIVAMASLPPEGSAARPLHRACAIDSAHAFAQFLVTCQPSACFDVNPNSDKIADISGSAAMQDAFSGMIAERLTTGPSPK